MSTAAIPKQGDLPKAASLRTFFDNFGTLAETPGGVAKLRALILDLAMRGQLVKQDENDEPAGAALPRILAAKARRGRTEKKRRRSGSNDAPEPLAWTIPNGWTSAPLSELVTVLNGRAYKKPELLDEGTPVLRVGNLFTSRHWYYSDLQLEPDKYCDEDDLIFAWSASFGPFIWPGPRVIYHYHIWKLELHSDEELDKNYLYRFLLYKTRAIKQAGHGVSMVHMTKEKMEQILVPLPPLAEQRRIVLKVDGLMSLCDELESRRSSRVTLRERASRSCLDRLVVARSRSDMASAWQRLSNHFEGLYTSTETIAQLRQAILQLAVQGKLVPQDPNDQPATELLERIEGHREQLFAEGKLRRPQREETPLSENDLPFRLPRGWAWVKLGRIMTKMGAGSTPLGGKRVYVDDGVVFLRSQNVWNEGLRLDDVARIPTSIHDEMSGTHVEGRDVLLNITGASIGRCALVPGPFQQANVSQHVAILRLVEKELGEFLHLCVVSPFFQATIMRVQVGVSREGLSMTRLKEFPFPVPPLPEQRRIVFKVDGLMSLCGELSARLRDHQSTSQQLLAATIHHLLNGVPPATGK